MLAVDHGYFLGPTTGLEQCCNSIVPLAPYADTLMLTRGVLRNDIPSSVDTPIVLRVSGGSSVLEDDLSNETIVTGVEECIRLNAAGMALQVFIGAPHQHQTIANLGKLVDEGERYGIPVIGVTAVGKDMVRDARYLALASRIIAETGGHIVKTYYCEDFERVTSTCPVPIVMAGGKKLPEREALEMTCEGDGGRRGRCRHGSQHLPVRQPRRHDQGRQRRRARQRVGRRRVRGLRGLQGRYRRHRPGRGVCCRDRRRLPQDLAQARRSERMPETMRAGVYYNNSDMRVEERSVPTIGPGEVLMRVHASGICGSDVMEWYRVPKAPIVLGHEVAGDIVEVGEGVDALPWATASWSPTTCPATPVPSASRATTPRATRCTPRTSTPAGSPSTCASRGSRPSAACCGFRTR